MKQTKSYDAIVIGAGPSGSASSAILAEYGHKVLVIEREKYPRYHIGESLIPFTHFPLKRLGLLEKMQKSAFVKKYSVQFVGKSGRASQPFYFGSRYPEEVGQTWQVLRSEFDEILMNNARSKGAEIIEETTVKEFLRDGDKVIGVRTVNKAGEECDYLAPITLDCSGKEAFAAVRNGWRMRDPYLNKVAVWTYYKGAKRDEGIDGGATTVAYVPEKGWFWYIPQHNDIISVGVVAEGKYLTRDGVKDPKEIFLREVKQNKWIEEHVSCGTIVDQFRLINEYTQHARHCASEGLVLAGDAFCFLDPVFSSGLMFALKSGVLVGDYVHQAIVDKDFSPARFAGYGKTLREGVENMRRLVYAFYDHNFSFRKLTDKYPEMHGEVTDCLSGDVNKDYTKLYQAISEFATVPEPLPYGAPLVKPVPQLVGV